MLFGQEKVAEYFSTYFAKQYNISATEPDSVGDYSIFIDVQSSDGLSKHATLGLKNKYEIAEFVKYIQHLKTTYLKWRQVAITNKVTDFEKIVDYDPVNCVAGFYTTDWYFDLSVNITAKFKVLNGRYLMAIVSDELSSESNEYVTSDGLVAIFTSADDFDRLLNNLKEIKVLNYYNAKKKKEELFK